MKDITIIIPVHKFDDNIKLLLTNALKSVKENEENYTYGKLIPLIVAPGNILEEIGEELGKIIFIITVEILLVILIFVHK